MRLVEFPANLMILEMSSAPEGWMTARGMVWCKPPKSEEAEEVEWQVIVP